MTVEDIYWLHLTDMRIFYINDDVMDVTYCSTYTTESTTPSIFSMIQWQIWLFYIKVYVCHSTVQKGEEITLEIPSVAELFVTFLYKICLYN